MARRGSRQGVYTCTRTPANECSKHAVHAMLWLTSCGSWWLVGGGFVGWIILRSRQHARVKHACTLACGVLSISLGQ